VTLLSQVVVISKVTGILQLCDMLIKPT